jgi:3-oxoacyl-[acyl-carrier protein] reductase
MLLEGKSAIIYGAGGAVGSAVARAFAREGAAVFLTGRTRARLDAVAQDIDRAGGSVATAPLDALDEQAVLEHADAVVEAAGSVDVSFNAISVDHEQVALGELSLEQIVDPVADRLATHVMTARAAARHMTLQGSGVILTFSADAARLTYPHIGSFGIACAAVEGLTRALAAELGIHGVRVICLRSMGSPESEGVEEVWDRHFGDATQNALELRARGTLLRRVPTLSEVGNVAR